MLRRKVATVRKASTLQNIKDSTEPGRCAFFNLEWTADIKVTKALLSRPDGDSSQLASQPQKRKGRPSAMVALLLSATSRIVIPTNQLKVDKPHTVVPRQFEDGAVVFVKADTSPGVRGERASSYVGRIVSYVDGTYQVRNVIDGGEGRCRREEERDMQLHRLSNSGMDGILLRSDLHASNTGPRRVEITAAQKKAAEASAAQEANKTTTPYRLRRPNGHFATAQQISTGHDVAEIETVEKSKGDRHFENDEDSEELLIMLEGLQNAQDMKKP